MGIKDRGKLSETLNTGRGFSRVAGMLLMALVICLVLIGGAASDSSDNDRPAEGKFCSATADSVYRACGFEAREDYFVARAVCTNISGDAERARCFADTIASLRESERLCRRQLKARRDACAALGEGRYDPDFDRVSFDDDYKNLRNPNRYFPLRIGNRWEYRGGTESVTVEVLDETKLIEGVRCVVVRDLVKDEGRVIEDTDDWFAQARDGAVWYCGEEVKDFQTFRGDRPRKPELVTLRALSRRDATATSRASSSSRPRGKATCIVRSSHWATPRMCRRSCLQPTPSATTANSTGSFLDAW